MYYQGASTKAEIIDAIWKALDVPSLPKEKIIIKILSVDAKQRRLEEQLPLDNGNVTAIFAGTPGCDYRRRHSSGGTSSKCPEWRAVRLE